MQLLIGAQPELSFSRRASLPDVSALAKAVSSAAITPKRGKPSRGPALKALRRARRATADAASAKSRFSDFLAEGATTSAPAPALSDTLDTDR